jgi:hypothetical protein
MINIRPLGVPAGFLCIHMILGCYLSEPSGSSQSPYNFEEHVLKWFCHVLSKNGAFCHGVAFVLPFKTGVLKYWRKPDEVHDRPVGLQSSAEAKNADAASFWFDDGDAYTEGVETPMTGPPSSAISRW